MISRTLLSFAGSFSILRRQIKNTSFYTAWIFLQSFLTFCLWDNYIWVFKKMDKQCLTTICTLFHKRFTVLSTSWCIGVQKEIASLITGPCRLENGFTEWKLQNLWHCFIQISSCFPGFRNDYQRYSWSVKASLHRYPILFKLQ